MGIAGCVTHFIVRNNHRLAKPSDGYELFDPSDRLRCADGIASVQECDATEA